MKEKSTIRKRIEEKRYKYMNKHFPCIEGYLYQPLDELIVLSSLASECRPRINGIGTRIEFFITKDSKLGIEIVENQKKVVLFCRSGNYSWSRDNTTKEIIDKISKKFNLQTSNRHYYLSDFEFGYNYRNCKKVVDIVRYILSLEIK